MKYRFLFILLGLCAFEKLSAQHYTAIHGSDYFGSLNVYNNPSSIVHSPYKWDLTLFGTQFTTISNAVRGSNFPLYATPSAKFSAANGNYARRADMNYNIRLLNARYSLNRNQAFAFGLNFKGYAQALTSPVNYTDSVKGPISFLSLNEQNRVLHAQFASSAWMELYGTYGFTLWDGESGKLAGGATLKISRGMSGIFASVDNIGIVSSSQDGRPTNEVVNGNGRYGYSSNHGDGSSFTAADLFSNLKTSFAVDLGMEYIVRTQAVSNIYNQDGEENDYEWKVGLALLDIGSNHYEYGSQSRQISSFKDNTTSSVLQDKFLKIKNLASFNDSLATIVNQSKQLTGDFSIANPARVVINIDRYVSGNFYVNGELSVNLTGARSNKISVKESNLVTITPRWESRRYGLYIPVQYTRDRNFWIGGAFRAGPLLLGVHNLLNIFSSNQYLSGGAYLALILRPSGFIKKPHNRQYDCPTY